VDADGDLDVVVGNWHIPLPPNPQQQSLLLLNDGAGVLSEAPPGQLPPDLVATAAVELGDLDGDGDLDLITVHAQGSPDSLYLNDGTGSFVLVSLLPGTGSSASYDVVFGDLDDDGDLDVIVGRRNQTNVFLRNDGSSGFTDVSATVQSQVVDATVGLALADVDGDQDLDVLVANRGFQKDRLLINRLRQLELPFVARLGLDWPVHIHVTTSGGPGFGVLWAAPAAAAVPIRIPPFGDYRLASIPPLEFGVVPVDPALGLARIALVVPTVPALINKDLHLQALVVPSSNLTDMRLTGRWREVMRD
jgi:hypothetical protein